MTTALAPPADLDERLAAMEARLEHIAAELEIASKRRRARDELRDTLAPVATEAYAVGARYLAQLEEDGSVEDLTALAQRVVASARSLDKALATLDSLATLAGEAAPITGEAFAALTARLAQLEARGYFAFAKHAAGVMDRVVDAFDEDDIDQLGENVVLILETVKEMTQPEVMQMLRRTATAVQSQQHVIEDGVEVTPSMWQLARQMREPEVRRGLSRALEMLRIVAADTPQDQEMKGDG